MLCPGEIDPKTGEQASDFCMKRTKGHCIQSCPTKCGNDKIRCPGPPDYNNPGCRLPDHCIPLSKSKFLFIYDFSQSYIIKFVLAMLQFQNIMPKLGLFGELKSEKLILSL